MVAPIRMLYVHVPFCPHICPYCSFVKTKNHLPDMHLYRKALVMEWRLKQEQFPLDLETVFWGGGTPTAFSPKHLEALLQSLALPVVKEWTMEANPETITAAKAQILRQAGVTRVSLGVQSFQEKFRRLLGRTHSNEEVYRAIEWLDGAGVKRLSVDLMFALPEQTLEDWRADLDEAARCQVGHISAYQLTYEEDTDFLRRWEAGHLCSPKTPEDILFREGIARLSHWGFEQYEVSNFARPGQECLHNLGYWQGLDYLGLGPGAVSTVGDRRWTNPAEIQAWAGPLLEGRLPVTTCEKLSESCKQRERVMLGLRTVRGIPLQWVPAPWREALCEAGYARVWQDRFVLTPRGVAVADSILAEWPEG